METTLTCYASGLLVLDRVVHQTKVRQRLKGSISNCGPTSESQSTCSAQLDSRSESSVSRACRLRTFTWFPSPTAGQRVATYRAAGLTLDPMDPLLDDLVLPGVWSQAAARIVRGYDRQRGAEPSKVRGMARGHGVVAANQDAIRLNVMKALEHVRVFEAFESKCRNRLGCPPAPVELRLDPLAQVLVDD